MLYKSTFTLLLVFNVLVCSQHNECFLLSVMRPMMTMMWLTMMTITMPSMRTCVHYDEEFPFRSVMKICLEIVDEMTMGLKLASSVALFSASIAVNHHRHRL